MKFNKLHLFLIIIGSLFLGITLCRSLKFTEGLENNNSSNSNGYNNNYNNNDSDSDSDDDDDSNGGFNFFSGPNTRRPGPRSAFEAEGINRDQIPNGDEDLYVLKSEIVPPVCPACPTTAACPRQKPCAPCPPCGRCPEPAFECKKVPNYRSANVSYLPKPVLADFSQF